MVRATQVYCNYLIKEESTCMHHNKDSCCYFFLPHSSHSCGRLCLPEIAVMLAGCHTALCQSQNSRLGTKNCLIHYVQYMASDGSNLARFCLQEREGRNFLPKEIDYIIGWILHINFVLVARGHSADTNPHFALTPEPTNQPMHNKYVIGNCSMRNCTVQLIM